MATLSEIVQFLTTPKPTGATIMGQVTPTPDLGNGRFGLTGFLTNAQMLTLNSASPDIIAAIPNKIIVPTFFAARINYIAAYSANASVALRFAGVAIDLTSPLQLINNALPHVDQIFWSDMLQNQNLSFATGVDLRGLAVRAFGSADVTLGDPGNTCTFLTEYRVIDRP